MHRLISKMPVTPGGVSTVLPRSCLIFQSTVRTQENHDIFREKLSDTAFLQQPRHCHGALMAFYSVPTVFMVEILCALTVLSLRAHGAHSACAALSLFQFYATPPCPMAMPLLCCGDACVRTARTSALCKFLGHCGITLRTPPWCESVTGGFTLLLIICRLLQSIWWDSSCGNQVLLHMNNKGADQSTHPCILLCPFPIRFRCILDLKAKHFTRKILIF